MRGILVNRDAPAERGPLPRSAGASRFTKCEPTSIIVIRGHVRRSRRGPSWRNVAFVPLVPCRPEFLDLFWIGGQQVFGFAEVVFQVEQLWPIRSIGADQLPIADADGILFAEA